ncbi:MAG: FTR1 family protein [Acidimicrobiia bacterium]
MLSTFIIGLREGLEAALIIGMIGAFLVHNSDRRALRSMWLGVGLAAGLCIAAAVALNSAGQRLPLQFREGLEGVLTLAAVGGVTYMLVWMKRHSRSLRSDLEARTAAALDQKSSLALVALAFVAVIREGLETAVFLLALVGGSSAPAMGLGGAALGISAASILGFAIYKGATRIDLARFFKVTGVFLVLLAAGLVASSIHEFAEAGWLTWGSQPAVDLSGIIAPGTIRSGLLTAFLGFQPVPTYAEIIAWAAFLVPAGWYVVRGPRPLRPARLA